MNPNATAPYEPAASSSIARPCGAGGLKAALIVEIEPGGTAYLEFQ